MNKEGLLAEIEDLLRCTPPQATISNVTDENLSWLGRASAAVRRWDLPSSISFDSRVRELHSSVYMTAHTSYALILTMLQQARHDLRMETVGPVNIAVAGGMVFQYFDQIRKIIEGSSSDLLFVDPYLDADFVSRYLPYVPAGAVVRLLTRDKLPTLLPAVDEFVRQSKTKVEVRKAKELHDRYVLVDRVACYQSGASFKDGAKFAMVTLTEITDAFVALSQAYEEMWKQAKVER